MRSRLLPSACLALLIPVLSPLPAAKASPPADSTLFCLPADFPREGLDPLPAAKRLADLNVGEPRTVRLFYFLPNDRPFRPAVVQRMKDEVLSVQAWYGEQMEAHGFGHKTFRVETDDGGDPVVHRVDGQHPDIHYLDGTWASVGETEQVFDLSRNINVFIIDNKSNRIDRTAAGSASHTSKQSGDALMGGGFTWNTLAHELGHTFGIGHDFRDDAYIMSYGQLWRSVSSLSACSAGFLAVHPYFDSGVGVEWAEAPAIELLSPPTYAEGSESVPIRLRVSDAHGLQQVRMIVPVGETHSPGVYGSELKACHGLMGQEGAVVEFDYDGVIPSGSDYGFSDLSDPQVHPVSVVAVDADGNRAGLSFDLWQVSRQHLTSLELADEVHAVTFVPGGTRLASGSKEGLVLWDLETRTGTPTSLAGGVTAVALSPNGATLASGAGSQVQLLDLESGQVAATLSGYAGQIRSLAFSPDGMILASGATDGIVLWDLETQTITAGLPDGSNSVAISPDGATLVSGTADGVQLWDLETQANVASYRHDAGGWAPRGNVNSVAFSPDETLVASGGNDTTVRLWEVATGNLAVLEGHDGPVRWVAFSADGTLLASGADLAVNLWDPVTKDRLVTLQGEGRGVNAVALSPDGTTLAAGAVDGTIGLWDVSEWLEPRPRRLVMVSGDGQQGPSGEPLDGPLVVEVRDQYDNPLPGVRVAFAVSQGDGKLGESFTLEQPTTDASGRTEVVLTLGPDPGTNLVEATVPGLKALTFGATGIGSHVPGMDADFQTWHLPEGAILRLGRGRIEADDRAVAFSSDGRTVAVMSHIGIWLYDATTSRPRALAPAEERISSMALSPDGTKIASGTWDGTIRLWEVATGMNTVTIPEGHPGAVQWLAFQDDDKLLAAGWQQFSSWDVATGTNIAATPLGGGTRAAFSPDGTILAAQGREGTIELWDVATATSTATLEGHQDEIESLAFSPDGSTLASGSRDHTIKLWDVVTGDNVATPEGHDSWVFSVVFSPDGRTLASGGADGSVKLWDVATAANTATFEAHAHWVQSVAFSPDGGTVASAGLDGKVMLWDTESGSAAAFATGHRGWVRSVALSPDGTTLATAFFEEIELWNLKTGTRTATFVGDGVSSVAYSPDGTTLAAGDRESIMLWNVATGINETAIESRGHRTWVNVVAFSPDGTRIASGHGNGRVRLWDTATGANLLTLDAHADRVMTVAFSPDGQILASGEGHYATDPLVRLWDVATGDNVTTLELPAAQILAVTFSPDGTPIASGNVSGGIGLWNVATASRIATLSNGLLSSGSVAASSPDRRLLLTGGSTRLNTVSVDLWDIGTQENTASLWGHTGEMSAVAFSIERPIFASGSADGTVLVWDMGLVLPHPRTLIKVHGDEQERPAGERLSEPLVVQVLDQHGYNLAGAVVAFAIVAGDGTLSTASDTTNASGRASTTLTLGEELGTHAVEVTVGDLEPVTFTATARATPDFDGDGEVGFADFFLFAEAFGGTDPRFDLDASGSVDFADFFLFAESFGQPERAKLLALARERIGLPEGPQLQQNAPNPFNSQTVISWFLLQDGPSRLEVYALTGQRVAVLSQGPQKAGLYRLRWDGRDDQGRPLASGVYLYRLVTSQGVHTRKLTLLR